MVRTPIICEVAQSETFSIMVDETKEGTDVFCTPILLQWVSM